MAIRPRAVLAALKQQPHNGILRAAGTDAAVKLLHSMGLRGGLLGELRERLNEMSETGEIVIECEGNRFNLIALPDALKNTTDGTNDGSKSVIAPPGQRKTTAARDGEGHELPAHLGPEHVGPLTLSYKNQLAGEAIAAAADLVREEIVKCGKLRYGREELLTAIRAYLLPLYDEKVEVAETLAGPVLSYLLSSGHAKRVPVPGRQNDSVIEIVLPGTVEPAEKESAIEAVQALGPIEALTRLVSELEAARQQIADLEARVENTVSIEVVAELTERAESLQTEKESLQRKLDDAAKEKDKLITGHRQQSSKMQRTHASALTKLREENALALADLSEKLRVALSENTSLKQQAAQRAMPEELQRRVDKILGK